jgi:hypothetical protein
VLLKFKHILNLRCFFDLDITRWFSTSFVGDKAFLAKFIYLFLIHLGNSTNSQVLLVCNDSISPLIYRLSMAPPYKHQTGMWVDGSTSIPLVNEPIYGKLALIGKLLTTLPNIRGRSIKNITAGKEGNPNNQPLFSWSLFLSVFSLLSRRRNRGAGMGHGPPIHKEKKKSLRSWVTYFLETINWLIIF